MKVTYLQSDNVFIVICVVQIIVMPVYLHEM